MKKEAQFLIKLLEKFDKQKVFLEQRRFNEKWSLIIYVRCTHLEIQLPLGFYWLGFLNGEEKDMKACVCQSSMFE